MLRLNSLLLGVAAVSCFANDNDAFIPEKWAMEGLAILEENMVAAKLVHRDFEDEVRDFGDVVNTRRPGEFKIKRKVDGSTLSHQDANATNVRVPLDQWFTTSFTIKDGEASYSFKDLIEVYLLPGMQTIARAVDRAVLGRAHAFSNRVGRLLNLTSANAKDVALEARQILNENKAYPQGRNLILSPASETAMLKTELFIAADQRGDGGQALEDARLGRIFGFETFMDQNVNSVTSGADTATDIVVTSSQPAGEGGVQAVTGITGAVVTGEYLVVAGNDQPTFITAHTETTSNTTDVTLSENNVYSTSASATTTRYKSCAAAAAYAAGYSEDITVDGYTTGKAPQVGQLIAHGTGGARKVYTVIESTDLGSTCLVLLDRPLETAIANNDVLFPGPYGSMNLAMHKNALALITRPLQIPNQAMGVMAARASYNDVAMRVTMQYDINAGGTVVNLDILGGVAVLDDRLAVVLQG